MTGTRRKKIKNSKANMWKTRSRSAETVTGETIDMENVNSSHSADFEKKVKDLLIVLYFKI